VARRLWCQFGNAGSPTWSRSGCGFAFRAPARPPSRPYRCWGNEAPAAGVGIAGALAAITGPAGRQEVRGGAALQREQRLLGGPGAQQRQAGSGSSAAGFRLETPMPFQRAADALLCGLSPSRGEISEARASYKRAPGRLRRSVAAITPRLRTHDRTSSRSTAASPFSVAPRLIQRPTTCGPGSRTSRRCWIAAAPTARSPTAPAPPKGPGDAPAPGAAAPGGLRDCSVGRNHRQNDLDPAQPGPAAVILVPARSARASHCNPQELRQPLQGERTCQAAADLPPLQPGARGNRRRGGGLIWCHSDRLASGSAGCRSRHGAPSRR